jgi:hypothetical protein
MNYGGLERGDYFFPRNQSYLFITTPGDKSRQRKAAVQCNPDPRSQR